MAAYSDFDFSHLEPAEDPSAADGEGARIPVVDFDRKAGSRRYTLLFPRKVDGRSLRHVTMAYPTQGDIDDWGSGEIAGRRGLICRMTGLHPLVFRSLAWPDAEALHQMFADMVPDFIVTGEE